MEEMWIWRRCHLPGPLGHGPLYERVLPLQPAHPPLRAQHPLHLHLARCTSPTTWMAHWRRREGVLLPRVGVEVPLVEVLVEVEAPGDW